MRDLARAALHTDNKTFPLRGIKDSPPYLHDDRLMTLDPFDTLVYLVERHGHLVGKDELLEAIWGGSSVEEGCLPRAIHVLRKALSPEGGDSERHRQYIETVTTKGYRFLADVTCVDGHSPSADVRVAGARAERRGWTCVDAVLEARRHHPRWGAKKLLRILTRKDPRAT